MKVNNEKGVALVISLLIVLVLITLGSIFIVRTVNEKTMSDRQRRLTQAFYIADGGSQEGLNKIDTLINTNLMNSVTAMNPSSVASKANAYVASGDGLGFLNEFVRSGTTALLTVTGTQATFTGTSTALGAGSYVYTIIMREKTNPLTVSADQWDFPYYYQIQTTATVNGTSRKVLLSGDFTVRVQRDNFAKYALYTNHHAMEDGTTVWFTNKTNFSGPVHTNERFSIAFNPSGTFDGNVKQVYSTARYYNNGSPILLNDDHNGTRDLPTFNAGFNRNSSSVSLASSVDKQDLIDQARGSDTSTGNGIFVANNSGALTGGIYIKGNSTVAMGLDGSDNAMYTITQGSVTKTITVNRSANQTSVNTSGVGTQTYNGIPDGLDHVGTIIYANGSITSLSGTVQKDTELTISSESDVVITNHVRYENYTPAVGTPGTIGYVPPNADGETNLLGIVAWNGDVRVGTGAPDDVNVHGTIMAQAGVFSVDSYDNTGMGPRGTATLLGGVISDYYGAFGLYSGSTGQLVAGYGRNFAYDNRLLVGKSPPYFPSLNTFIGFTNDITDKVVFQEGGF